MMNDLLFLPIDINIIDINFELEEENVTTLQHYWNTKQVKGKDNNYEKYRWLIDQLPFNKLNTFTHKIQNKPVEAHTDMYPNFDNLSELNKHLLKNEPSGYHIVLQGKNDSLEVFDGNKWINTHLPNVPGAYLLNLMNCLHRVKEDHLRETLYVYGWVDEDKHNKLIECNLKKYGHLAIYKSN